MKLKYRELSPEEFEYAPREVPGSEMFTPENSRIVAGINEEGEIVASFTLFFAAHLEPVWIRKDYRNSFTILRRLEIAMKQMLKNYQIKEAYTVVLDSTPVLVKFARFFGATPVPGKLYNWKDK